MNNIYFEIIAFFYIMKDQGMIKNFKKKFFSEPTIINIFDLVQDFVNEYHAEPTEEQVVELVRINGKDDIISPDSIKMLWQNRGEVSKYGDDWLKENVANWGKFRSFYTGLESTIAYVQQLPSNIAYADCETYINKAANIFNNGATFSVNTSEGYDFFDFDNHIIKAEDTHSTGWKFIDLCLKGGFTKKGLYVFMGAPKVGKSQVLCNLAANSVRQGHNTIYITLEMSYQKVAQRIGANLFNINYDEYSRVVTDKNYMNQASRNFMTGSIIPPGKFFIEEFPTSSASASDIENFVLKKEAELSKIYGKEFKFDNVFIDYLNIMRDQRGSQSGDTYNKVKNICEDVRAMGQRNLWAVISVTQVNATGYETTNMTMSNVSESKGLIATVDALFGILQTQLMRASNVYYLQAVALRDSPHNGDKKKYIFDPYHLRITEDPSEDIIPDTIDVPAIYRSATTAALAGGQNQKGTHFKPSVPPSVPTPLPVMDADIGKTESLFKQEVLFQ